ncbi:MAG: hypothetical protein WAR57_13015 [Candidatus Phosphoribacter sp.]|nr:hypothetical protein [Actinomycetales bacterium]
MTSLRAAYQVVVFTIVAQLLAAATRRRDRGDVPGWVLITVMTAGLVSALWIFAGPALLEMLTSALASVTGKK